MIFSSKIYKILNGENATLYSEDDNSLLLYIFDKSLKNYRISLDLNRNCVFLKSFNYKKIIQLNQNQLCLASNGYITLSNSNEL